MCAFIFAAGFANAIVNALFGAAIQLTTPQEMRGKVFSLLGSAVGGLTPIAMAIAGVLAEFVSIRILISSSFMVVLLFWLSLLFSFSFRQFINFDPDRDALEGLMSAE